MRLGAAGFLAGWAAISEYTVAPVALLLAIRSLAGRRPSRLGFFVLGAAVPLALLGIYDTICFGAPWVLSSAREAYPSYSRLAQTGLFGFGAPRPDVALDYLVHPSRGILLFSPFLAWCVPGFARWWRSGERRPDCLLALTATALYFVAMTGYPNWHGGWALGSRYLLPVLFFPAAAIGFALKTPLSRGLFAAAVVFSVAGHFLLTATFPYFPDDMSWPVATGSLWFLERGWVAPNLLDRWAGGGIAALALSGAAFAVPLGLSLGAAGAIAAAALDRRAPRAGSARGAAAAAPGALLWSAAVALGDLRRLLRQGPEARRAARRRAHRRDARTAAAGRGSLARLRPAAPVGPAGLPQSATSNTLQRGIQRSPRRIALCEWKSSRNFESGAIDRPGSSAPFPAKS